MQSAVEPAQPSLEPALKIKNLSVTLGGRFEALKNIDLALPPGKIIGLIGPSGAGKTTLIRCIVGRLGATAGSVTIFGRPAGSPELRRQLSYMPQELSVYPDLTVRENMRYFVTMFGQPNVPRGKAEETVDGLLGTVGLADKAASLVSSLSGGQKQRVSLAIALIGSPKLLVLDEPTVGLDPVLREKLWDLFAGLAAQGATLLVASHSMDEASRCDDLVLIRDGEILAHDSPRQLCERTATTSVEAGFLKLVGAAP